MSADKGISTVTETLLEATRDAVLQEVESTLQDIAPGDFTAQELIALWTVLEQAWSRYREPDPAPVVALRPKTKR